MTNICSISLPHFNHTISLFFLRDFLFNITVLNTNFDAHFNALMLYIVINVTKTKKKISAILRNLNLFSGGGYL